jgi:diguanylate cyclase (GGDEF)-like protein
VCQPLDPAGASTSLVLTLFDISHTGLRVISPLLLGAGRRMELRLFDQGEEGEFRLRAEIAWAAPRSDGTFWIGLRLEKSLSDAEVRQLIRHSEEDDDGPQECTTLRLQRDPDRLEAQSTRQACLVRIYPTGPDMGKRHFLEDQAVVLGRDQECTICLPDHSASRQHAKVQPVENGFEIVDLESTNGTYVNQLGVDRRLLRDGDYVQLGASIFRFLAGGNVEADYHEEIYRLTISDALTNIANKRYLLEFLERELARSRRYGRPLSVVMFDVDHFKDLNDRLGHLAGDFTLREMAASIRESVRREELFARYGGEEFALVLPETPLEKAILAAERLRELIGNHTFSFDDSSFQITLSAGVVCTTGEEWLIPDEILRRADEKLYQAKRQGRNCVVA